MPELGRLAPLLVAKDNGLEIASLLDFAGTKASVSQVRAETPDRLDMDALARLGGVGLPFAFTAAQNPYGASFNPEITLKALSCFDDGNLRELPADMKFRLVEAVKAVTLDRLPRLRDFPWSSDRDRGRSL